jgi:hypothetical protein
LGALQRGTRLDRDATATLAATLFPGETFEQLSDELCIGCFSGVPIVAAKEFAIDYPSKLPPRFIEAGGSGTISLHAMHSVVDCLPARSE